MHKIYPLMLSAILCSFISTAYASPLNIEKISNNADNNAENCLIFNKDIEKSPLIFDLKNYLNSMMAKKRLAIVILQWPIKFVFII